MGLTTWLLTLLGSFPKKNTYGEFFCFCFCFCFEGNTSREIVDSQEQHTHASQTNSPGASRKTAWKNNISPNPPSQFPKILSPLPKLLT